MIQLGINHYFEWFGAVKRNFRQCSSQERKSDLSRSLRVSLEALT